MTAIASPPVPPPAPVKPPYETLADLLRELGDIPLERVLFWPYPGTATDEDVDAAKDRFGRLCELIDGVLVEKPMGWFESSLAIVLIQALAVYDPTRSKLFVLGADGTIRTDRRRVRLPDVSIYLRSRFVGQPPPQGQILEYTPDIPVEVLSPRNTRREMATKRGEYFRNGASQVWQVHPESRTVRVYGTPGRYDELTEDDVLDGGEILPGFQISVREWFQNAQT